MSNAAQCVLIFLLVLSPLYIPIAVTIVAAIGDWREAMRTRSLATAASSYPTVADEEPQPLAGTRYPSPIAPNTAAA